jgi:hypothetical protein
MKSGIPDLSIEISGGLGVNAIITNNGDSAARDINVEIYVEGGIFGMLNKSVHQTLDLLAGESKIVSTGLFLSIGKIDIIVSTDYEEKSVEGKQIFILTII